ncbi:hypothetical protein [Streptomyces longispororuber]|uniref:hypothetical protein n=1 Tax=Streptomyces longispororuber TaxID=68230 RepID=UPI0036FEE485
MNLPVITRADVERLLASPGEDPVLYLNDEGGVAKVDVWVSAYVHHAKVLAHRYEVVDAIGDAPDAADVEHYLRLLQQAVEEAADRLE